MRFFSRHHMNKILDPESTYKGGGPGSTEVQTEAPAQIKRISAGPPPLFRQGLHVHKSVSRTYTPLSALAPFFAAFISPPRVKESSRIIRRTTSELSAVASISLQFPRPHNPFWPCARPLFPFSHQLFLARPLFELFSLKWSEKQVFPFADSRSLARTRMACSTSFGPTTSSVLLPPKERTCLGFGTSEHGGPIRFPLRSPSQRYGFPLNPFPWEPAAQLSLGPLRQPVPPNILPSEVQFAALCISPRSRPPQRLRDVSPERSSLLSRDSSQRATH